MPDDNKTTDTNPAPTQDVSGVGQTIPPMEPSISTPIPPPVSPTDQGQTTDAPPSAANSTVPPPPPIIEEQKEGKADIPPIVTTGGKPKGKVSKKVIATILGILFLVGGVSAGVILVQQQQEIREEAAESVHACLAESQSYCIGNYLSNDCWCGDVSGPSNADYWCCTLKGNPGVIVSDKNCCPPAGWADYTWGATEYGEDWCFNTAVPSCVGDSDTPVGSTTVSCGTEPDSRCNGTVSTPTPTPPTPTPTPTPTDEIYCSCLEIQAFDTEWNELTSTELSNLKAGNTVRFTVSGTTNSGNIDKARFRINSPTWRTVVVAKKPGTNKFYDEYTIPEGVTGFTINAQLHHTSSDIGWF